MKFGHNLPRNQVPEWGSSYINYKGLKKLIKATQAASKQGLEPDLAGEPPEFFFALDRNLEDIDGFYNKRYADSKRRLRLLHDRYGDTRQKPEGIDRDEAEEVLGALLELRGHLRKLQWFGEVNRRGFVKITKKLDKKMPGSNAQQRYLLTKVDPLPFATNFQLSNDLKEVNDWLSELGDTKLIDDSSSVNSNASLKKVSSKIKMDLSLNLLETVDYAIRSDDAASLSKTLCEAQTDGQNPTALPQALLLNLLQRSVSCRSRDCISQLLTTIDSLEDDEDINQRNCIHRLTISIGRTKTLENQQWNDSTNGNGLGLPKMITPASSPIQRPPSMVNFSPVTSLSLDQGDSSVQILCYVLDALQHKQRSALVTKDMYGRIPLHYAAQYGFVVLCQVIMDRMKMWDQVYSSEDISTVQWQDIEGNSPLDLSVLGGHLHTTKLLLRFRGSKSQVDGDNMHQSGYNTLGASLALATKSNFVEIVQLLVEAGADVHHQDDQGETALHIAAQFGFEQCAHILIAGNGTQRTNLNIPENTFSWTPLFVAAVEGNLPIVEQLIAAGADLSRLDSSGWSAKEHAALRGHIAVSRRLAELTQIVQSSAETTTTKSTSLSPPPSPSNRPHGIAKDGRQRVSKASEPVKTFGHRYLTQDSMILVSLGTMDSRKEVNPVKLDNISLADAHATELDTALSVVVSASGGSGEATVIDLPVQENISTDPMTFTAPDPNNVKLFFDIIPTYAGSHKQVIGRGVALLSSLKTNFGPKRISLHADVSVPIMAAGSLDVIGSVNFNFLIVSPFSHPKMTISEEHTYWKKMESTMLIGHRGLGKNVASRKSLQLGENTLQSFISAANLGASYVEFDVQLTKDLVPVIYHDFLVSETGIDAPVHTLTLEQFLHLSGSQSPTRAEFDLLQNGNNGTHVQSHPLPRRRQSYSAGMSEEKAHSGLNDRMRHTRDFKIKGFKGNTRGHSIQSPFTTLEEMFKKLPESTGFNIEMKYPMLYETEEEEMDTYAVELNSFVDTVLTKVYDLGGKRNIIFSSFNPEMCILLSLKQPSIPILFLTDAGTSPAGDIRAGSLQEAIRFAVRWNLLGVVSAAEPIVQCPRLVKVVKESGLVCVTYGTLNNDPDNVKLQVREGIDAVIVDSFVPINPRPFLQSLVGKDVIVRLKWKDSEYTGRLVSTDSYMNIQLSETEEYMDGKPSGQLGQVLIRCNNVLWIAAKDQSQNGDAMSG
ncbi:MAG: Glycerophosphocholine phosphodiesterase [Bogoriella megaspora]|nr:MAG: Glycerophosphocholine phosphodiesterase [Bogoriella megaspora]